MSNVDNRLVNLADSVVQPLTLPEISQKKIAFDILRLDKIHPVISGNKWFKLQLYIKEALQQRYGSIVTFGGAWSNHIIATAYITQHYGIKSIGVIRGEKPSILSKTLLDARDYGMTLEFISRELYSRKNDDAFIATLEQKFHHPFIIPEGGAGPPGVKGCEGILSLVDSTRYSHIICCMGTGTMYMGLVNASLHNQEIIGIPVLKGMRYLTEHYTENLQKVNFCKIIDTYHFGGYAKKTPELIRFMNFFYLQTGIPTDFVYTGKLLYACRDLVINDYFPPGSHVLAIHSGGLQGNTSLPEGTLLF